MSEPNWDAAGTLGLEDLASVLRAWRNHWTEVARIYDDFPEVIKQQVALRPTDMDVALQETRAQFAVLFHPEAMATFVSYVESVLDAIESLLKPPDADDVTRRADGGDLDIRVARLEEEFAVRFPGSARGTRP